MYISDGNISIRTQYNRICVEIHLLNSKEWISNLMLVEHTMRNVRITLLQFEIYENALLNFEIKPRYQDYNGTPNLDQGELALSSHGVTPKILSIIERGFMHGDLDVIYINIPGLKSIKK